MSKKKIIKTSSGLQKYWIYGFIFIIIYLYVFYKTYSRVPTDDFDLNRSAHKEKLLQNSAALSSSGLNPFSGKENALKNGEELYNLVCKNCHGLKGEGGAAPALRGKAKVKLSQADIFYLIMNGKNSGSSNISMPAFRSVLGSEKSLFIMAWMDSLEDK